MPPKRWARHPTAEENKTVSLWDVKSGREAGRLSGFDLPVVQVFFTGDRRHLVATEVNYQTLAGHFSLWDIETRTRLKRIEGYCALAVDTKAGMLAATTVEGKLSLWSLPAMERKATWPGDGDQVLCGAFSPNGKLLATGRRGTATLWRLADLSGTQLPLSISTVIRGLAFSPDGSLLVSVGDDGVTRVWDVASATPQRMLRPTDQRLWSAGISPDGTILAVGADEGSIELRDLSKMNLHKVRIHKSSAGLVSMSADSSGDRVAVLDASQTEILILDAKTGNVLDRFGAPQGDKMFAIAFSSDDQSLWTGTSSGLVRQRNLATGTWRDEVKLHSKPITKLRSSPSGRFLIIMKAIWDRESSKIVLAFDDDSKHHPLGFLSESIAVSARAGVLQLWDLQTGQELPREFPDIGWVMGVAATPDSKVLAIASVNGSVHLCDVASGRKTGTLLGHRHEPTVLAFSPDGWTLATASSGGEIKLWHVPTAQPLCDLTGHRGAVRLVGFSRDARRLVTAADIPGGGSEVFVWGLSQRATP